MRRLVGLLLVATLIATAVAVAAPSGARQAKAPGLSPVPQSFSLIPPRPQKPKSAPVLPPPIYGYSCPAASHSQCSRIPCQVFVASGQAVIVGPGVVAAPRAGACTRGPDPLARTVPIAAR